MSNYLRMLKLNKQKMIERASTSRSLVPANDLMNVMARRDDLEENKTYLRESVITSIANQTWQHPNADQKAFVRLVLALWITSSETHDAVHFVKEYFFDIFGNMRNVSDPEVINAIINQMKVDPLLDYIELNDDFKSIDPEFANLTSTTAYRDKVKEKIDVNILCKLVLCLYNQNHMQMKSALEYISGAFLLCFIKTGSVTSYHIEKRLKDVNKMDKLTLPEFTSPDFLKLYEVIKSATDDGKIDPSEIISYFSTLLENSDNMKIKPLVNQASYRNLTALYIISKSLSEFPDFPWAPLLMAMPSLRIEAQRVLGILREIGSNNLIGYQISGAASSFANLAGLCLQLQIVVKNQHTLNDYKGVGSIHSIGKVQLEKFRKWATEYSLMTEGVSVNISEMMKNDHMTADFFKLSVVSESITNFLSDKIDEIDDEDTPDEIKRFFGSGKPKDDDDDNDPRPPRGAPKRPRLEDFTDDNLPPAKQSTRPTAPPDYPGPSQVYPDLTQEDQEMHESTPTTPEGPKTQRETQKPRHPEVTATPKSTKLSLSPMKVSALMQLSVQGTFPDMWYQSIMKSPPQSQQFSVPSMARISALTLTPDETWGFFAVVPDKLDRSSIAILAVGIVINGSAQYLDHPQLVTGPSGSRPFTKLWPTINNDPKNILHGFIAVALFVIVDKQVTIRGPSVPSQYQNQ